MQMEIVYEGRSIICGLRVECSHDMFQDMMIQPCCGHARTNRSGRLLTDGSPGQFACARLIGIRKGQRKKRSRRVLCEVGPTEYVVLVLRRADAILDGRAWQTGLEEHD